MQQATGRPRTAENVTLFKRLVAMRVGDELLSRLVRPLSQGVLCSALIVDVPVSSPP
jgi:hypothetical protein